VTKWLKINQDNLRIKCSALNADFSSLNSDFICSWRFAQADVKDGCYHLKSCYFRAYTAIDSSSVKTVADGHRLAEYDNKQC